MYRDDEEVVGSDVGEVDRVHVYWDDEEVEVVKRKPENKRSCRTNYNAEEHFLVSKAFMKISTDPTVGINQSMERLFQRVGEVYEQMVNETNMTNKREAGFSGKREEDLPLRSPVSLKSTWYSRILKEMKRYFTLEKSMDMASREEDVMYLSHCMHEFKMKYKVDFIKYCPAYDF